MNFGRSKKPSMVKIGILLYRENGWISTPIKWQTRGPYSHAALLRHGVVWESHFGTGVVCREPEEADMRADLFAVSVTQEQSEQMGGWLFKQCGKKYDLTMVLRFLTRRPASRRSSNKWFCSELVYAAFAHVGIDLLRDTEPWEVSPNMLRRSPLISDGDELLY